MIEQPRSDRQVVDAVLAGDSEAFRVLVDRESGPVIAVCRRITGDPDEANDAAQEAFIRAYRSLATFRGDGPFGAWVTRIAARAALARLATRREGLRMDVADQVTWPAPLTSNDDPEERAIIVERRRAILDAIAGLPASQRDVVAMRFLGDLTMEEIARATRAPLGTVKSRLHRALESLREQFSPGIAP